MKFHIYGIFFFLFICINGNSQQLYPFPQPNLQQGEIRINNNFDATYGTGEYGNEKFDASFQYIKDTIIDTLIYSYFEENGIFKNKFYTTYDNGKVYKYFVNAPDYSPGPKRLIYDFSLSLNDTFLHTSVSTTTMIVDSVGSILLHNGQIRKYLELTNGQKRIKWVDGIGDIENGFLYNADFEDGYNIFVCHSDSSGLVYNKDTIPYGCISNNEPAFMVTASKNDICLSETVTFNFIGIADSVIWEFNEGITIGTNNFEQKVSYDTVGSFNYYAYAFNNNKIDTFSGHSLINVHPFPSITSLNATSICSGEKVYFKGNGADFYEWDNEIIDGSYKEIYYFGSNDTVLNYSLIGTSNYGCKDTLSTSIYIKASFLQFLPILPSDTFLCYSDTLTVDFSDFLSKCPTCILYHSYSFFSTENPAKIHQYGINDFNGPIFGAIPDNWLPYNYPWVIMIENPISGCPLYVDTVDILFLEENYVGDFNFSVLDKSICDNESVEINFNSDFSIIESNVTLNNNRFNIDTTFNLKIIGQKCSYKDTVIQKIDVSSPPSSIFTKADTTLCKIDTLSFLITNSDTVVWNNQNFTDSLTIIVDSTQKISVEIKDTNHCNIQDSISIKLSNLPPVFAGNDTSICKGDSILINANNSRIYTWEHNIANNTFYSPQANETVFVLGKDSNICESRDSIIIIVYDEIPNADFILYQNIDSINCISTDVNIISTWFIENSIEGNDSIFNFNFPNEGEYSLCHIAKNVCFYDTICKNISIIKEGISDIGNYPEIELFPNPTNDIINIRFSKNYGNLNNEILIYNTQGQQVESYKVNSHNIQVNFSEYPKGIYYLKIDDNIKSGYKIIKN